MACSNERQEKRRGEKNVSLLRDRERKKAWDGTGRREQTKNDVLTK